MKILFVALHEADRAPGQRFRFEEFLPYFTQKGIDWTYSTVLKGPDYKYFYKKGHYLKKFGIVWRGFWKRWSEIKNIDSYDIVFLQREAFMLGTYMFERKYAKKSRMIFDFDDAIWQDQVSGPNKLFRFLKNPAKTNEIIRIADLVFAGNQFLADHAKKFNDKVVIVPTTIDTDIYTPAYNTEKPKVCIGWSGSFSTIAHFNTCLDALRIIKNKYGDKVYFKVIGDGTYKNEELGIQGQDWKRDTEVKDLQEIDIGIMPLPDDDWSKGKCGLKGLQYMALSIPTIMSPVGVNSEIITDGKNGFLAAATDEWVDKLSKLIESSSLRKELGENGRNTVVNKYSVRANRDLYLEYFEQVAAQ